MPCNTTLTPASQNHPVRLSSPTYSFNPLRLLPFFPWRSWFSMLLPPNPNFDIIIIRAITGISPIFSRGCICRRSFCHLVSLVGPEVGWGSADYEFVLVSPMYNFYILGWPLVHFFFLIWLASKQFLWRTSYVPHSIFSEIILGKIFPYNIVFLFHFLHNLKGSSYTYALVAIYLQ